MPEHLSYDGIQAQLQQWQNESNGLLTVGTYGRSARNKPLTYAQVHNPATSGQVEVLITGAIHGNETTAADLTMAYIGQLLDGYGKDARITQILDSRDIYFIPSVSPDSYEKARYVDGVDPNRDFPSSRDPNHKSTPSIKALEDFFLAHQFRAVISGHTYGRQVLRVPGESSTPTPDEAVIKPLADEMARLADYKSIMASQLYGSPIHGSEIQWYYNTRRAFAVVLEYHTSQRIEPPSEIKKELERVWPAILLFLEKAPMAISGGDHSTAGPAQGRNGVGGHTIAPCETIR